MLPLASFTDPARNAPFAIAALAASFFCFGYSTRYGAPLILLFYAVWLPLPVLSPARTLRGALPLVWIAAFPAVAMLSVLWSAAPGTSGRAAIQYATCVVAALVAARVVPTRTLATGGAVAVSIVTLWSVLFGRSSYDPIDASYTFVGLFGSKNQLGFFASVGVVMALARLLLPPRPVATALVMLAAALFNGAVVVASGSATSILTLVAALATLLASRMLIALPPSRRFAVVLVVALLGAGASVGALWLGAFDAVLGLFGKDATLTGRTYLWSEGIRFGDEAPWLGTGYQAWWVRGFAEAERLWAEFYIGSRSGFHFHNTFIQLYVDLGGVGLAVYVATFLTATGLALRRVCAAADGGPLLDATVLLLLFMRSFAEVDTVQPYTLGTFLFVLVAARVTVAAPVGRSVPAREDARGVTRSIPYPTIGVRRARI